MYSSDISQVIISRRMRCTGLVARTGERRGEMHRACGTYRREER